VEALVDVAILITGIIFYVDYNKTPILTLSNLNESVLTTEDSQFTIKGSIDLLSDSEVTINVSKVKLESDGSFSYKIDLSKGKNDITITVTRNGKKITSQYTLNYIPKKAGDSKSAVGSNPSNPTTDTNQGATTTKETTSNRYSYSYTDASTSTYTATSPNFPGFVGNRLCISNSRSISVPYLQIFSAVIYIYTLWDNYGNSGRNSELLLGR